MFQYDSWNTNANGIGEGTLSKVRKDRDMKCLFYAQLVQMIYAEVIPPNVINIFVFGLYLLPQSIIKLRVLK